MRSMRAAGAVLVVALTVLTVSCAPAEQEGTAPSSSPSESSASPSSRPSPSASESTPEPAPSASTPAPAPAGGLDALPFEIACDALVTPEALYEYNPNVGTDPAPQHSELVTTIVEAGGVACGWLNQSSGARISAGVIRLSPDSFNAVQSSALDRAEPTGQIPGGYFRVNGGIGHAEIFERDYWVVVESVVFVDPSEAAVFAEPMRSALP